MTVRHFLKDSSVSPGEQAQILNLALKVKAHRWNRRPLTGPRAVAVLTDKPTLRTQLSFCVGVAELGGYPMFVDGKLAGVGQRESVADVARVLGRQVSAIVWRTYGQDRIEEMAAHVNVPVINALTDDFHPCQVLADLLTVAEHRGGVKRLRGAKLAYFGDGANNMAHSYLLGGATAGMNVVIATPDGYRPKAEILTEAQAIAEVTGAQVSVTADVAAAASAADVVATDTWVSMGQEGDAAARRAPFVPFRVDDALMAAAAPEAIFLHCLPAYRGNEVTESVIDGPQSRVWDEAENRLHAQKALLIWLLRQAGLKRVAPAGSYDAAMMPSAGAAMGVGS
ncbi:MAG: ornithine carbamoyltransferase [Bifidobacteriaceae bacterium]|jgi:ornithine carbamoyltransferase|nr:ornithine carbamoyltransferase [Bifidobacteriaceae bacterium]